MEEIWKDIEGYPNYQVSNMGRVKSLKFGKEKILKSNNDGGGYFMVNLSKDRKQKTHRIHRLVASAFLPNPDNLPQVNHKDEDKSNNRVENIEYCDAKYNNSYGTRIERIQKPILQFTKEDKLVRKWSSLTDVEIELGIKHGDISKCCKGKRKAAGDYKWGYAEDYERIPFKVFDLEIYKKKRDSIKLPH